MLSGVLWALPVGLSIIHLAAAVPIPGGCCAKPLHESNVPPVNQSQARVSPQQTQGRRSQGSRASFDMSPEASQERASQVRESILERDRSHAKTQTWMNNMPEKVDAIPILDSQSKGFRPKKLNEHLKTMDTMPEHPLDSHSSGHSGGSRGRNPEPTSTGHLVPNIVQQGNKGTARPPPVIRGTGDRKSSGSGGTKLPPRESGRNGNGTSAGVGAGAASNKSHPSSGKSNHSDERRGGDRRERRHRSSSSKKPNASKQSSGSG